MSQPTGEVVASAFRRALPLILVLALVGAGIVNVLRQSQGPSYAAEARVFLATTDLGAVVSGIQPSYVDPRRVMENALSLARASELYDRAAERLDGVDGAELRAMIAVEGSEDADLLIFTSSGSDTEVTEAAVNAVASEYPSWRAEVSTASVSDAVRALRRAVAAAGPAERPALQAELNRLEVLETLTTGNTVLVERAEEAVLTSPKPVRDSILGAALGIFVALLITGGREILDTRVRSESEAEELLEAPSIATLAPIPKQAKLVTLGRHQERFGDSYALLANSVMQLGGSDGPTVVAVTSATKEQGKTVTAANLAVALALRGVRVVLADFDLRRPSVSPLFRIPADTVGLLQVVRDGLPLRSALRPIPLDGQSLGGRRHSPHNGAVAPGVPLSAGALHVLPAGGAIHDFVSHAPRVTKIVADLKATADFVILDTPPALSTPDMAQLSKLVDVVLVTVRQGRETRRGLVALHRQAQSWGTSIHGLVITDSESEDAYGYYTARTTRRA